MIRVSEVVLPGHPDKLCDQIADAVVAACVEVDADAYAQIEVGIWRDHVWLSGGLCTREPLRRSLDEIARDVIRRVGFTALAQRCSVQSTVCDQRGDPRRWSASVNDQAIVIGWAGYDAKTRWLPPEHFLAHAFRDALAASFRRGPLEGHGPDGKLLLRLREDGDGWHLEHLLATVQQRPDADLLAFSGEVTRVLRGAYESVTRSDPRWRARFGDVELLINPNGPFLAGGSEGDNGQTGRKLVMDYYGPRVPIGGGALSGKHVSHIDRIGAYAARQAAIHAVATGATDCLVRLCWAPNVSVPLDVTYQMTGRGKRLPAAWFDHCALFERYSAQVDYARLAQGTHFVGYTIWNQPLRQPAHASCGDSSCDQCSPPNRRCTECGALFRDTLGVEFCSLECATRGESVPASAS